jgi:hypothetical protein
MKVLVPAAPCRSPSRRARLRCVRSTDGAVFHGSLPLNSAGGEPADSLACFILYVVCCMQEANQQTLLLDESVFLDHQAATKLDTFLRQARARRDSHTPPKQNTTRARTHIPAHVHGEVLTRRRSCYPA